ncbi:hypothetical protein AN958_03183 [Leucoagaricus sp. SymC.cos]|nr:hypothetical protein AN958_03183 [Leucoagaricus sp. SymC.cos]
MNPTPEQLMIGKRLRDFSASWIRNLRDTLQTLSTLPRNSYAYPLPSNFPFFDTSLQEKIHWIEVHGNTTRRYGFVVHFEYHLDTTNLWSPAVWIVRSSAMSILGRVEVDFRILSDTDSPVVIDEDFVLEMMLHSFLREQPMRFSSRVVPNINPVIYPGVIGNIEIFELRTFDGVLVLERGRRMVANRICSMCDQLLPPSGPNVCISHLLNT